MSTQMDHFAKKDSTTLVSVVNMEVENILRKASFCILKCSVSSNCDVAVSVYKDMTKCILHKKAGNSNLKQLIMLTDADKDLYIKESILEMDSIEFYSDSESRTVFLTESVESLKIKPKVDSEIVVHGNAAWMLYSGESFQGKRFLLRGGYGPWNDFAGFTGSRVMSVEKIQAYEEKPIGLQNRVIIPDSSFQQKDHGEDRTLAYYARLNEALTGFDMLSTLPEAFDPTLNQRGGYVHSGSVKIQVDLGGLYRVYGVTTQGVCYCGIDDITINNIYFVRYYKIEYSMGRTNPAFTTYTNEQTGEEQLFEGNIEHQTHSNNEWFKIYKKHVFEKPFLARHVRFAVVEGYYSGVRMEFHGQLIEDVYWQRHTQVNCLGNSTSNNTKVRFETCEEHCLNENSCVGFTWENIEDNECFGSTCDSFTYSEYHLSYLIKDDNAYTDHPKKICQGSVAYINGNATLEQCANACSDNPTCNGFTVLNGYTGNCVYQSNCSASNKQPDTDIDFYLLNRDEREMDQKVIDEALEDCVTYDYENCLQKNITTIKSTVPHEIVMTRIRVDIFFNLNENCSLGQEVKLTAYVHDARGNVNSDNGLFVSCSENILYYYDEYYQDIYGDGAAVYNFLCDCAYGVCEFAYVRVEQAKNTNCFSLQYVDILRTY